MKMSVKTVVFGFPYPLSRNTPVHSSGNPLCAALLCDRMLVCVPSARVCERVCRRQTRGTSLTLRFVGIAPRLRLGIAAGLRDVPYWWIRVRH